HTLISFAQEHPYLERIKGDVNLNGQCKGNNMMNYPCTAIEFYIQPSLLSLWFSDPYSSGYIYIPFTLTQANQVYLKKEFSNVQEVTTNWYQFSGEND